MHTVAALNQWALRKSILKQLVASRTAGEDRDVVRREARPSGLAGRTARNRTRSGGRAQHGRQERAAGDPRRRAGTLARPDRAARPNHFFRRE